MRDPAASLEVPVTNAVRRADAAQLIARRGEWQALPDLGRALDRLAVAPIGDCPLCVYEDLVALEAAIRSFGGELSDEQEASIDDAAEASRDAWIPVKRPLAAEHRRTPATRSPRPGRNDPCPCGSGKKYKHCHLRLDELETTH